MAIKSMKNNGNTVDEKRKMQFQRARCSDKMAGRSTDDGAPPILRSSCTDQILWGRKVKEWPPIGRLFKFLVKRLHKIPSNSCKFSGALPWDNLRTHMDIMWFVMNSFYMLWSTPINSIHYTPGRLGTWVCSKKLLELHELRMLLGLCWVP